MPDDTSLHLYDLSRLAPLIEAGQLVLTPNFRLARRIKSEWDNRQQDQGLKVWHPAPVHALESWLLQRWQEGVNSGAIEPRVKIDTLQVRELWARVIDEDRQEHGEYSLLQTGSAAELAQQARDSLLRWQVDMTATAVQSEFRLDADCDTFRRWMQRFEQRLDEAGLATAADCLVDLLSSELSQQETIAVLVDFDDLQPLHRSCLDKLCASVTTFSSATKDAAISVRSYPDRESELTAVARWAFERQQQSPGESTCILLADMQSDRSSLEYLLRREFNCLGDNYTALPINFSTGISLDQAPVIRDALRILASCTDELPLPDVTGLFTSRFIPRAGGDADKSVKLLKQLYEDGQQQLAMPRLRHGAQQVKTDGEPGLQMGVALREADALRLRRAKKLPSQWLEPFCKVLDLWGWPGNEPLDSLEYQQVEHWYRALEGYASLDGVCGELDLGAALGLLRRYCQGQVSQPETADSNIQVLGPLEGAGLHFDAIWLCGLQGSRWPAPARPNPFVPVGLQKRHDMPHASAEREWQYAQSLMSHYRGACTAMTSSYCRQADGVPELPSPLLEGLPVRHCDGEITLPAPWLNQFEHANRTAVEDLVGPKLAGAERENLTGGSGILQGQASCPFRAFANYRLSVEPLGDYRSGLSAAQKGTILHNALFALWGEIVDSSTLQDMDSSAAVAAVERAAASAIEGVHATTRQLVGAACLDLEQRRLAGLLGEWLALERGREPFAVIAREEGMEFQVGGLSLRLRVDRVDELSSGETLVIDYKSGRSSLSDWLGERPSQPQLPLYGIATEVDGVAFAQVRSRDCKIQGLGKLTGVPGVKDDIEKAVKRSSSAQSWGELKTQWRNNLESLAGEFLAGEARVEPLSGACNYCGLQPLCRVELPGEGVA